MWIQANRQTKRNESGKAMIEILEDRRMLSASVAPAVAAMPLASPATPPDYQVDALYAIYPTAGVPFNGQVGTPISPGGTIIAINWGDGVTSDGTLATDSNGNAVIDGTHTYAEPGRFTLTVTESGGPGGPIVGPGVDVSVVNAAPATGNSFYASDAIAFGGNVAIIPALASAPASVSIDWGDGSSPTVGTYTVVGDGTAALSGVHTYATPGNYTVTVSSIDPSTSNPTTIATSTGVVIPVDTSFKLTTWNYYLGQISNEFPLPFAISSATVDWGDGTESAPIFATTATAAQGQPIVEFDGSHTYSATGNYTVTISVIPFGSSMPVVVAEDPTTVIPNMTVTIAPGVAFSGVVASDFQYFGPGPTSISIDWGDGTAPTPGGYVPSPTDGATEEITGSHTYATAGNYVITITGIEAADSLPPSLDVISAATVAVPAPTPAAPPASPFGPGPVVYVPGPPMILIPNAVPPDPTLVYARLISFAKNATVASAPATGVAGARLDATWSTSKPSKLPGAISTVVIRWGDGTHTSSSAISNSSTDEVSASAGHAYRKAGVYRAIATFMEGRRVIRRVVERFTIFKNS